MVLIVDDDPAVCASLARRFKAEGLAADSHPDAEAAWCGMRLRAPAMLVLDYRLPGMDGLQLLAQLRADAILAGVPVLIYSAIDEKSARAQAERLGAAGWYVKASDHDEMVAAVLRITGAAAA